MARKLLHYLKEYQEHHNYWFSFGTEATLNMAQHEELLELFRAANFGWVFIGIESPDPASLKETLKTQNLHEDILTSVRRIYSYGIDVLAGFIIGFDNDTLDTFEHQYRFITDAGIQSAMIGLLTALPKTPLYERLEKEGRLSTLEHASDNTRPGTNIIPKGMPYDEWSIPTLPCTAVCWPTAKSRCASGTNCATWEVRCTASATRRKRRWASCGGWSARASFLEVRFACGISCVQCPG